MITESYFWKNIDSLGYLSYFILSSHYLLISLIEFFQIIKLYFYNILLSLIY